ncbi:MAG: DNA primase [Flavobacteriales bacterium]
MIPKDVIDRVLDMALIEEVIGEFVQLKRSGSSYKGLSPFNNEKTPSFYVIPSKGIFKDFSSGKGGSVITFLMEHEKMSYPEAIRWLAQRYNIEIEEEEPDAKALEERSERESLLAVTEWAAKFFEDQLWKTDEGQTIAHSYFTERGFRDDTIKKFRLGYCPKGFDTMTQAALAAGYELKWLIAAGLTRESSNGRPFDFFNERVMFPIRDVAGRVIAFGGRILGSEKKTAKYFNSPENALYNKSRVLYGIDLAKQEIVKSDRCFLVEGYTDVVSLYQAGVHNVVASSGTALTEEQVRLIRRYSQNVTILYDGDPAGIRASFRGINLILSQGLNVRVVLFPDGDDPDSFAKKSSSAELEAYIDQASRDFISFKTDVLAADAAGDPVKRAGMIRDVVESIACIPDAIKRSVYINECSSLLDIDEQVLLTETNKILRQKGSTTPVKPQTDDDAPDAAVENPATPPVAREVDRMAGLTHIEHELARLLIRFGTYPVSIPEYDEETREHQLIELSVAEYVMNELEDDALELHFDVLNEIISIYKSAVREGSFPDEKAFLNHANAEVTSFYCAQMADRYTLSENWTARHRIYPQTEDMNLDTAVKWCLFRLKQQHVMFMARAVEERLKVSENQDEQMRLLEDKMKFDRIRIELTRFFGSAIL